MKKELVYFVTLIIKYTTLKGDKTMIYQKIDKMAEAPEDAIQNTLIEAQMKFHNLKMLTNSVTLLTPGIFNVD